MEIICGMFSKNDKKVLQGDIFWKSFLYEIGSMLRMLQFMKHGVVRNGLVILPPLNMEKSYLSLAAFFASNKHEIHRLMFFNLGASNKKMTSLNSFLHDDGSTLCASILSNDESDETTCGVDNNGYSIKFSLNRVKSKSRNLLKMLLDRFII